MKQLVLSLFPGIGLLDRAFEEAGFCIVRGPDLFWGGDIRRFHPPAGHFAGVIGGPPCKGESNLARLNGTPGANLRGEFVRVVREACPHWWIMEAVKRRPDLDLDGAKVFPLNNRWLGEDQNRRRYFHSNLNLAPHIELAPLETARYRYAVLANHGCAEGAISHRMASYTWPDMLALQGLPADFDLPGFTREKKREALGNAVPLPMGRAIAHAVRRALLTPEAHP